ncbi:MAG: hypothetical protein MR711_01920 [Selenomonas sp.]|uniref:cellulase N-terminal Ig-like domain-containing protein n=1 Tax=Selenomonas sp. TaxID=2053611 RepID=UPI0025DB6F1A|nr:cellulase N-terminal Ig-like domain-containing protein [Selenomonas sp.]MCI6085003.1 hypothetical protein [Selenomonas sp.]
MKNRKWLAAIAALVLLELARPAGANPRTAANTSYDPACQGLHVDQIGYLTGTKKEAFVATGAAPEGTFELVDATTGASDYTGKLSAQKHDDVAGEDLQTADFTGFNTPGTYKLKVGDRLSYDFEIGDNVYALPTAEIWRSYALMRSGTPIKDPVTGLDVPEGHPQDGLVLPKTDPFPMAE